MEEIFLKHLNIIISSYIILFHKQIKQSSICFASQFYIFKRNLIVFKELLLLKKSVFTMEKFIQIYK